jgi:hypothetical protein
MRVFSLFEFNISKPVLAVTIFCSIIMIVDSTIVVIYSTIPENPDPLFNSLLFIIFIIIFALSSYILVRYSRRGYSSSGSRSPNLFQVANLSIIIIQFVLTAILVFLASQILQLGSYEVTLVFSAIYISHISAIGYLMLLTYQFARWFIYNRKYVILIYAVAFSIIISTLIISEIFLSFQLSYKIPLVKLKPIKTSIADYSVYSSQLFSLSVLYTYLSIVSFVSIWIPSVILLKTYSMRLGKIRYWMLMSIPLVYFLFPFFANQLGIFDWLLSQYGTQFVLIYYITFSPYKQIGGLLFGIVFWIAASKIKRKHLKTLLRTASMGMILLFGSTVLHGMTYIIAPPFGLVTISFMGLASYMLLIGIFTSSKELSIDSTIRREIYKIAGEQFSLLKNISVAELNILSEKKVKAIQSKMNSLEDDSMRVSTDESDYKKFIEDAINEVHHKGRKTRET